MKDGTLTVRISLDGAVMRLVVVAVLLVLLAGLIGSIAWAREPATADRNRGYAPLAQGGFGSGYYLTASTVADAGFALEACADGYHMAALWEILDVSNLTYNTSLGFQHALGDGGAGPPTGKVASGWVRTGNIAGVGPFAPGADNCASYSSGFGGYSGTVAYLPNDWSTPVGDVGVWLVGNEDCDLSYRVWCVED
jgi:hypothetical protein